jgi:prepilin peptidase CpaA
MQTSIFAMYAGSICFVIAILTAGLMDLITMKIRNELVLFLFALYAALAPLTGINLPTIGLSATLASILLAITSIFFSLGWIGGGDAKLASVISLWLGLEHTLDFLVYTAIFGGLLTLLVLQFRRMQLPAHWLHRAWISRLYQSQTGVPYGVAISAGALTVFPNTLWSTAFI